MITNFTSSSQSENLTKISFNNIFSASLVADIAQKVENLLNITDEVCREKDVVTLIARSGQREITNQVWNVDLTFL